jgi:hypothetical protein
MHMHGGVSGVSGDLDQQTPTRRIVRRVGLPSGRAVIGAVLITVSIIGLFVANQRAQREPTTSYAVVTTTVPAGTAVEVGHLRAMPMDLPDDVANRAVSRIDDAVGAIAVETLHPGQVLSTAALLAPTDPSADDGEHFELSLSLDRSRALDAALRPGELVDVVATLDSGARACTRVVADRARVMRSAGSGDELLTSSSGSITVTVAIDDPVEVLAVVHAVDQAEVTVVRATRAQQTAIDGTFCAGDEAAS